MIIAISSTGNDIQATLDQVFGRCSYFAVYDTETKNLQFFENPAKDAPGSAGPIAAQFLLDKKVTKIISGEFGPKVKPIFEQTKVEMLILKDQKSIESLVEVLV